VHRLYTLMKVLHLSTSVSPCPLSLVRAAGCEGGGFSFPRSVDASRSLCLVDPTGAAAVYSHEDA
jgi:hypothetical protein